MNNFSGPMGSLATPQNGRSMRATSTFREGADGNYDPNAPPKSDLEEKSNRDNFRIPPGQTHVIMDVEGPGVMTHMWITFLGPEPHPWAPNGSANHQEMLLRIYWDGNERPGVEAPLGDFFGGCFGKRSEVISMAVVTQGGDSYNCFWHMPFRKSARVEIVNESDKPISLLYYNVDWIKKDSLPEDTPYFYAQYNQSYPLETGEPYVLLETKGKGHYVGTVFAVRTRSPMWFGEGDEMIAIDGEEIPSVWGTGTEDYFLCAWGLEKTLTPYFGVPYFDQWGIVGGHTSAYRWHVNDPILFNESIRVAFETFGWISPDENPDYRAMSWNPREDDYSSVAFWYQTGEPTFTARTPHARERKLPNIERAIFPAKNLAPEGSKADEELPRLEYAGRVEREITETELRNLPEHFEHPVLVVPTEEGIRVPISVGDKEPLRLLINVAVGPAFGIYQAYLDGVKLREPMDFYSPTLESREFHLLDFWPEPGNYVLSLEFVGKHHLSSGPGLGIESVRLRERRPRVRAMAHDANKDWRAEPIYYE
ncbi:MAG TPA: glycoside hydrolase family 172 protein [Fimbriimonadaceae bacterium]|nr:glycoside hydrolase family 172 protein [Fimbriimonadaceae bacterium]